LAKTAILCVLFLKIIPQIPPIFVYIDNFSALVSSCALIKLHRSSQNCLITHFLHFSEIETETAVFLKKKLIKTKLRFETEKLSRH